MIVTVPFLISTFFSGQTNDAFDERCSALNRGMKGNHIAPLRSVEFVHQFVHQYPFIILKSIFHAGPGDKIRTDGVAQADEQQHCEDDYRNVFQKDLLFNSVFKQSYYTLFAVIKANGTPLFYVKKLQFDLFSG